MSHPYGRPFQKDEINVLQYLFQIAANLFFAFSTHVQRTSNMQMLQMSNRRKMKRVQNVVSLVILMLSHFSKVLEEDGGSIEFSRDQRGHLNVTLGGHLGVKLAALTGIATDTPHRHNDFFSKFMGAVFNRDGRNIEGAMESVGINLSSFERLQAILKGEVSGKQQNKSEFQIDDLENFFDTIEKGDHNGSLNHVSHGTHESVFIIDGGLSVIGSTEERLYNTLDLRPFGVTERRENAMIDIQTESDRLGAMLKGRVPLVKVSYKVGAEYSGHGGREKRRIEEPVAISICPSATGGAQLLGVHRADTNMQGHSSTPDQPPYQEWNAYTPETDIPIHDALVDQFPQLNELFRQRTIQLGDRASSAPSKASSRRQIRSATDNFVFAMPFAVSGVVAPAWGINPGVAMRAVVSSAVLEREVSMEETQDYFEPHQRFWAFSKKNNLSILARNP